MAIRSAGGNRAAVCSDWAKFVNDVSLSIRIPFFSVTFRFLNTSGNLKLDLIVNFISAIVPGTAYRREIDNGFPPRQGQAWAIKQTERNYKETTGRQTRMR
jgi:hypothetical protein